MMKKFMVIPVPGRHRVLANSDPGDQCGDGTMEFQPHHMFHAR